jgi:predicted ATPase/class 3 adenylate cyclase
MAKLKLNLPTGTVTFLFTDIEGSTKLAQKYPELMPSLLTRHNEILKQSIEAHHGFIFRVIGDSMSASFHNATDALQAALEAQRALQEELWSPVPVKVRMGINTGAAQVKLDSEENPYSGYATLALTQRIMSAGHGGQILLSQSVYDLTRDSLPKNAQLINMGEHHLKDILRPEHIYQITAPDLPSDFPPLNTLKGFHHNLPTQLTSFIGREKEMAEIKSMLHAARLVTLTGSGGTGKSRLAIEVGREELANFAHRVWLIELAPLTDEAQIIPTIAQIFGLQENPFAPLATLVMDYLREKKILLLLDNCEHLIESCAHLADELLHQSAGLKILASSREALGITGETAYHTPSLAASESTRLFVDRARAANPKFSLTDANAASVAQICSRLDGIPLAIELAAARTKLLSVDQIAARLDDRFRLLVGGSRTALPRQQTLRALIDWSYDLLSEEEKRLLQFASVFVGGWTLDALEAVADDPNTIEHLEQLVNKSLVVTEERGNEMRYFMLETIRQYAREKLFDAKKAFAARDRHFQYFDHLAEHVWNVFYLSNIHDRREQANDEAENLRAAAEWGLENHVEESLRLAANYCLIAGWLGSRPADGLALSRTAVERVKSLPPAEGTTNIQRQKLLAKAFLAQGMVGMSAGTMPVVIQDLQKAIALSRLAGDKLTLGYSLEMFFTASTFINAPDAEQAAEEGYRIFREEVDSKWGLSMAYQNKTRIALNKGEHAEKEEYLAKFKELIQDSPQSFLAGFFYLGLGMSERFQGNYEAAKACFEEGLNIFKHIQNKNFQLIMKSELGHVARQTGKMADAKKIYRETLTGWQDLGNRGAIANQLECFAFIAITEEEPHRAAKLLGAAASLRIKVQSPMTHYEQVEHDQFLAQLRLIISEPELNSLWAEGQSMTMEQAIQFVLDFADNASKL